MPGFAIDMCVLWEQIGMKKLGDSGRVRVQYFRGQLTIHSSLPPPGRGAFESINLNDSIILVESRQFGTHTATP